MVEIIQMPYQIECEEAIEKKRTSSIEEGVAKAALFLCIDSRCLSPKIYLKTQKQKHEVNLIKIVKNNDDSILMTF